MPSYHFAYQDHLEQLVPLLRALESELPLTTGRFQQILKAFPREGGRVFRKDHLVQAYRSLAGSHGLAPFNPELFKWFRMKPVRTASGVTPITVLTKPFPCPGRCIFCPNDIRMPKSYLSDEPGAQRAERNFFDPYLQTYNRLQALHNIGHTVDKCELIILGGTWSYYPEPYQIWFIKECFRALNEFGISDDRELIEKRYAEMERRLQELEKHGPTNDPVENHKRLQSREIQGEELTKTYNQVISEVYVAPERLAGFDQYQAAEWDELFTQHKINETASQRCIGLVIETRPDNISEQEVIRIRKLGCTKTQIGVQSLQDDVLSKNNRGHDVGATRRAFALLRQAGFKIHAHWMANLYGSSPELDKKDFEQLFEDPNFRPDELKIYPCSLIGSAELMQYYRDGRWQPYTREQLLDVLTHCLRVTQPYCRLTRVIRDIPSTDIVEGNKLTNFRQLAEESLRAAGEQSQDIRAREIKSSDFDKTAVQLIEVPYQTSAGQEIFLQLTVRTDGIEKLLAFLRLSLPASHSFIPELAGAAVIREIHVYGQTVGINQDSDEKPQHLGFGKQLIQKAKELAREHGYQKLAVISAIGTREYYRKRGFADGELYQLMSL